MRDAARHVGRVPDRRPLALDLRPAEPPARLRRGRDFLAPLRRTLGAGLLDDLWPA